MGDSQLLKPYLACDRFIIDKSALAREGQPNQPQYLMGRMSPQILGVIGVRVSQLSITLPPLRSIYHR